MKCHTNVNATPPTKLPHTFSYIVAILIHNHFESPNSKNNVRNPAAKMLTNEQMVMVMNKNFETTYLQNNKSALKTSFFSIFICAGCRKDKQL
jgi:hypothetical protein